MKKQILIGVLSGLAVMGAAFGAYTAWLKPDVQQTETMAVLQGTEKSDGQGTYKEFVLETKEQEWQLDKERKITAWTYDGTVPGAQLRVKEGERVKVLLKNTLQEPVSIHWHGYPVPNAMDGIPGVTQNAVKPGESFTYEFVASVPGTYWYHSHQDSSNQVDRGLYGTFIVEPKAESVKYDRDYTLVLDEWNPDMFQSTGKSEDHSAHGGSSSSSNDHSSHGGSSTSATDHSAHGGSSTSSTDHSAHGGVADMSHDEMMKMQYTVYTVNGRSGDSVQPLQVNAGERVKLRFINAGFTTHLLHLQGQPYRITHSDGQEIEGGIVLTDKLLAVAPGERYDIEFTAEAKGNWSIDSHDDTPAADGMRIPVQVDGQTKRVNQEPDGRNSLDLVDITRYSGSIINEVQPTFDIEKKFILDSKVVTKDGRQTEVYTINGQTAPDIEPVIVKKGQKVKFTLTNPGTSDHPMHLHGHFFRVLSKNGQPLTGDPLMKDTLNVRPGEAYEISFTADNDGEWMIHCHDLHHAAAGMMTHLLYDGHKPAFTPDPSVGNKPE